MKNYPEKIVKNIIKGPTPTKASDLVGYDKKGMDYDSRSEILEGKKEKYHKKY